MATNSRKRRKTNKKLCIDEGKQDRLSTLPDSIIVDILSLLPFKSAIATTILARRWATLWTQLPDFTMDSRYFTKRERETSNFFTAIDDLLAKRISSDSSSPSLIRRFSINFWQFPSAFQKERFSLLNSWFRQLCDRQIEEITVTSSGYVCSYPTFPTPPPFVFRCRSLVVLEWSQWFDGCLPKDGFEFDLPNLKKLRMPFRDCNGDCESSLSALIRSCPVLEDLALHLDFEDDKKPTTNVVDLSCPNLKRLSLWFDKALQPTQVVINTPNLEYLSVLSFFSNPKLKFCFVENPIASLLEAEIRIAKGNPFDQTTSFKELLQVVSDVGSLTLTSFELGSSILFGNLTQLTFSVQHSGQSEELMALLHCCPVLEVLSLKFSLDGFKKSWTAPEHTPVCISSHIKMIELEVSIFEKEKKDLLSFVVYLLGKAGNLERLFFEFRSYLSRTESEELQFCKDLYNLPRSSSRCQIKFSGTYYKSSVNSNEVRGPNGEFISLV